MQVILILGAAVWANGPSPALQRRCDHGFRLWERDKSQIIVPCGGLGDYPPSEASSMKALLVARGVPAAQIICEDQSTSTFENLRNAAWLLRENKITKSTVVSDIYHLPRAAMVARYFGFRPRISGPSLAGTHAPTQARHFLREAGALPLYALRILIHKLRNTKHN